MNAIKPFLLYRKQGGQMKKFKIRKKNSKIRKWSENFTIKIRKNQKADLNAASRQTCFVQHYNLCPDPVSLSLLLCHYHILPSVYSSVVISFFLCTFTLVATRKKLQRGPCPLKNFSSWWEVYYAIRDVQKQHWYEAGNKGKQHILSHQGHC